MEVYILDDMLRRVEVIDNFESLIWTEREKSTGDFDLVLHSTPDFRRLFTTGTHLAMNESDYVMIVENVENKRDAEGRPVLTITGRSLEQILVSRIATEGMQGLTDDPKWKLTGTPANIARTIFQKICVEGLLSPSDIIPFITSGTMYSPGTILESNVVITVDLEVGTVYARIKELCDAYGMGFRLTRNLDTSQLYFEIYSGSNRTSQQSTLPPVIFSPDLDNMADVSELASIANHKNVAYVLSKNGAEIVYAPGVDPSVTGFDRRVLVVKADDVSDPAGPGLSAILQQKGREALAEAQRTYVLDGEITKYGMHKYRRDYFLGDLVEMRNSDGATNYMRVTEHIFASDAEGERSYPTLAVETVIEPGTWLGWDPAQDWEEAPMEWAGA
jgi:hypothetical protein